MEAQRIDPRTHITPDAFKVAPTLLGTPLASPGRRAAALVVDLALAAILAELGGFLIGLGIEPAEDDSLSPEERAEAIALLGAYAQALDADDRAALDSLQDRIATLVAARPMRRLRAQIQQHQQRIGALEDDNERLAEEAANPSIKRIVQTAANDFGLTLGWMGFYFTLFLAWWHGLTPGKRLFGLQVVRLNGEPITLWVAFERFGGYAAGIATGLLGFFQVFWDPNRQGIHDRIAGTAVIRTKK